MVKRVEVILALVCILVTFAVYAETLRMSANAARSEFQRITERSVQALQIRMDTYLQSLNGAAGLMQASESIGSEDF